MVLPCLFRTHFFLCASNGAQLRPVNALQVSGSEARFWFAQKGGLMGSDGNVEPEYRND